MAASTDAHWPSAASLLRDEPIVGRRNVALLGVSTFATSVSKRSATSTPAAVREALQRYSTWSFHGRFDLADNVVLVDHGDVDDPDGEGGHERVAAAFATIEKFAALTVILGGDNAATWHALSAVAKGHLEDFGLITLDAHLDMREGRSNGSPIRQLLDEGLDPRHVVQVGLGDFSNSAVYARESLDRGVRIIERHAFHREDAASIARRALEIASHGGRKVYVDVDLDVADRSVVPGCPASAPGGLSADELRNFVREVTSYKSVVAVDFTEVDAEQDSPDQRTVGLAALLVLEALAGVRRRAA
ncbi:MAG: formimidoylglutamase [Acidimicrobiaceae bacterium]|nr:formimidoylglutamase [Acidimicrobiaceae bacterium]